MNKFTDVILSCTDCPFNGQDNVYCRTCSIPAARTARLAHRIARHRRRATARLRRWLLKNSDFRKIVTSQDGALWVTKVSGIFDDFK